MLEVKVNLAAETATVTYATGAVTPSDLIAASKAIGYPATVAETAGGEDRTARKAKEARDLSRHMAYAAALTNPVFIVEMGGHVFPAFHHWINAAISQQTSCNKGSAQFPHGGTTRQCSPRPSCRPARSGSSLQLNTVCAWHGVCL